jgi:hypothetical protein
MAGDWIKMRPALLTSPKVNGIARILEADASVAKALSTGFSGCMNELVTRNVMRYVTVTALLSVWGAANEHTRDGVFANADLSDIDDIAGVPGFGAAMVSVGWAHYDADECIVLLPNFNDYNTSGSERSAGAKTSAARQKEYRDRKKLQESNVTSDVTSDVTSNRREEKRREEIHTPNPKAAERRFAEFWLAYPNKVGKDAARKAFDKRKPDDDLLASMLAAVESQKHSEKWAKDGGQYIPNPATWLNQGRWMDESDGSATSSGASLLAGGI